MQLTPEQYKAFNQMMATGNDAIWRAATPGMSDEERSQWVNYLGGSMGGNGPSNPGLVMDTYRDMGQGISSLAEPIKKMYMDMGVIDPSGTKWLKKQDDNGNWVAIQGSPTYTAQTMAPGQSWSGTNAQGGFTGGTGVGVTSGAFNSQTGAPMSLADLTAALHGGSGASPAASGGPAHSMGGGSPGGAVSVPGMGYAGGPGNFDETGGGLVTNNFTGTGAGGGGSTPNGNTGDTGGLPTASASTYSSGAAYKPPEDVTTPWDFFNDKGYQFALDEGKKAVENSAAARGSLLSGNTLKELSDRATGTASQFYGDAYNRYNQDRAFKQGVATDARNYNNANNQWDATFNNNNRMWDTTFNNNNRIDARNFDYSAALNDRNFLEDQRRYDQGFNYTAANNDANRNTDTLKYLAGLGANANNASSGFYADLARLLSSNNLTGAGANASGNMGGANSLTSLFSTIFPWLYGTGQPTTTTPKP